MKQAAMHRLEHHQCVTVSVIFQTFLACDPLKQTTVHL